MEFELICDILEIKVYILLIAVRIQKYNAISGKFYLRIIITTLMLKCYTETSLCDSISPIIHYPSFSESRGACFFVVLFCFHLFVFIFSGKKQTIYQIPKAVGLWDFIP